MHFPKIIILAGLSLPAALAQSACGDVGGVSTVTVTVNLATKPFGYVAETAPEATLTSTATTTNVLSLVEATSEPVVSTQGPYSFAEHAGTTVWLGGKTPPVTEALVIKTSAVTVLPVPESSISPGETLPDVESFTTLTSTSTTSKVVTETLIEPFSTPEPSAKPFTGLAPYGWNSSMSTLITIKVGGTGNALTRPTGYQPQYTGKPEPVLGSVPGLPLPVTNIEASSFIAPRQLGSIVVATIEGQVVSWTNNWNGGMSDTAAMESTSVPALPSTTLAVNPWNVDPTPKTTTSPVPPTTVLGIYPWNLPPVPAISASVDQSAVSWSGVSTTPLSSQPSLISLIPGPTAPANVIPASNTVAAPRPSCSDKSPFTIGFDDLPHFAIDDNPNGTDIPPIFNPYRKLYWENHFGYVPPPSAPFSPVTGEQLAVYRAENLNVNGSPDAGLELFGEFGAGPRATQSAYWIDAFSMYFGCSNAGPSDCEITLNGYNASRSTRVAFQTVIQPPCPGLVNCKLAQIEFNDDFRNLSGVQIIAAVDRRPVTWYMDELVLGWSNNSCEATTERNSHR